MDKFFGTTVAPGKDLTVDIPNGHILRITQLAITNASDKVSLVANVEGNNFTVATLNGGAKIFQVSTSLVFSPDQAPKLQAKGTGTIHVTGTLTNVGDTHIDDEDDVSLDDDVAPARKGGVRASDLSDDDSLTSSQMRALAEDGDLDDFDMDEEDLDAMDMDDDESLDGDAAANLKDLAKKASSTSPKQSPKMEAKKKEQSPPKAQLSPKQAPAAAPAATDLDGEGRSPAFNSAINKLESGKSFAELDDEELEALDEEGLLPDGEDDMPEDFNMMDEGMGDFDGLDDEDDLDDLDDDEDESEDLAPPAPKQQQQKSQSPKQQQQQGSPRGSANNAAGSPRVSGGQQQNSAQRPSFGGRGGGSQSPAGGRGGGNFSPNRGRGFGSPRGSR